MKACVVTRYGPPEVIEVREVAKPVPRDNEVLVKVHAGTVTAGDTRMRGFIMPPGFWLMGRLALGITGPRRNIPGMECAGVVETVGKGVNTLKPCDSVAVSTFWSGFGGCAEYKCAPEQDCARFDPERLDYGQAAALPVGAITALAFLRAGNIKAGDSILINGASGSVGTYAVQLAKHFGAEVTAVCRAENHELVQSLGADHVIDYTLEDFTQNGQTYDILFDAVGKLSFRHCHRSVKPGGVWLDTVLVAAGPVGWWRRLMTGKRVIGNSGASRVDMNDYLRQLTRMAEEGALKVVIDREYPYTDIIEAHRHADTGHKRGNVIVRFIEAAKTNKEAA